MSGSDPELLDDMAAYFESADALNPESEEYEADLRQLQASFLRQHGAKSVDGELEGGVWPVRVLS